MICNLNSDPITEADKETINEIHIWLDGVIGLTIVIIGMIMNTIATFILRTKEDMKHTMTYLLSFLFIINNIFLLTQMINILHYDFDCGNLRFIIPYFVYPLEKTSVSATVFIIVCLAHQTYILTWDPKEYKSTSASKDFRRKRTVLYVLPTLVIATIINIPRWFAFTLKFNKDKNEYKIRKTVLKKTFEYVVFYENFFLNIITVFIPITLLVFFKWSVYNFIRENQREIESNLQQLDKTKFNGNNRSKNNVISRVQNRERTNMLIVIIFLFISCHLPRCFSKFYDGFYTSFGFKVFESVQRLLLIIHASGTPIIYIRRNRKFWKHMHELFCCPDGNLSWGTTSVTSTGNAPNNIETSAEIAKTNSMTKY